MGMVGKEGKLVGGVVDWNGCGKGGGLVGLWDGLKIGMV